MKKIVSLFSVCAFSFSLFACSNEISNLETSPEQVNALATVKKNSISQRSMNQDLIKQIVEALDINKDGMIDVTEAPIGVMSGNGQNFVNLENYDYDNSYTEFKGTQPLAVNKVVETFMQDGGSLSVSNAKISEKNKAKVISALSSLLVKDSIADGSKVYAFSSNVGYFTGKSTYILGKLDASGLGKAISKHFEIEKGSVNGITKQTGVGSISIARDYITVDKYNTRISFSSYSTFDDSLPLFGSHKIKDPKVIR